MTYAATALLILLWILPAHAQETVEELTPLDFGLFSLRDNDAQHEIIVDAGLGTFSADPAFVMAGDDPQRGEYRLENLPADTEVFITIDPGGLTLNGGGGAPVFNILDYTVHPNPVMTGPGGDVDFFIGATLRTLGDGNLYDSGDYLTDLDITFSW